MSTTKETKYVYDLPADYEGGYQGYIETGLYEPEINCFETMFKSVAECKKSITRHKKKAKARQEDKILAWKRCMYYLKQLENATTEEEEAKAEEEYCKSHNFYHNAIMAYRIELAFIADAEATIRHRIRLEEAKEE